MLSVVLPCVVWANPYRNIETLCDQALSAKLACSAVELMRQLGAKAKPACHFYPLAMHTGEMMPPPTSTESALGEERVTKHVPVGRPFR